MARARFIAATGARDLRASRSLISSFGEPPAPIDELVLPGGDRLRMTLEEPIDPYWGIIAIVRRYSGCKLVPSFGQDGKLGLLWGERLIPPTKVRSARGRFGEDFEMLRLASGRIVLGGSYGLGLDSLSCCRSTFGIAAITQEGDLDLAFGDRGFADVLFQEQQDDLGPILVSAEDFRVETDGSGRETLVLEGRLDDARTPGSRPAFARFTNDGQLLESHVGPP